MAYIREEFLDLKIANIDNREILENEFSLARWIADATVLLSFEGESCVFNKQLVLKDLGISFIPDFYFEKGIKALDIQGRTIIQLKDNLLLELEIGQTKVYEYLLKENLVDKILLVYIHSDTNVNNKKAYNDIVQIEEGSSFINRIKKAINEEKGEIIPLLNKKKRQTWEDIREDRLARAINDFIRFDSVLFTGAGVSMSACLPSWDELLKELISNADIIKRRDYDKIYKEMDFSNLISARYIQNMLQKKESKDLIEKVRTILYSNSKHLESRLIDELSNMIINHEKVRSVITYNYDTLLENSINNKGKRCFSVYRNSRDEYVSFPIYHVHGIVFPESNDKQTEGIILSEKDYHRVYSEVYDWSNVEQLHALTRCTCFFIGLSMKDPNLRRLLEIAKSYSGNAIRHYVFLERRSFTKYKRKSEIDYQIRENIMADLGLHVIWYKGDDNHKELPQLLKRFTLSKKNSVFMEDIKNHL